MTLVLNSNDATLVIDRVHERDYIFYTDKRLKSNTFKLLHSLEFVHGGGSDNPVVFDCYLLFGQGGEEYYIGTFHQTPERKAEQFPWPQQIHTVDNDYYTESVFTVRLRSNYNYALYQSESDYDNLLGQSSNHLPLNGSLGGTVHPALAVGDVTLNSDHAALGTGTAHLNVSDGVNAMTDNNAWTCAVRFRFTDANVDKSLITIYGSDVTTDFINVTINGSQQLDINDRRANTQPLDDGEWYTVFLESEDRARIVVYDKQGNELEDRGDEVDLAPHDTAHAFIGTALEPGTVSMLANYGHMRYVSANGVDTGPLGLDAAPNSGGYPAVVTHDGRECLDFVTGNYGLDVSAHAEYFFVEAATFCFWAWCDDSNTDSPYTYQRFISARDASNVNDRLVVGPNYGFDPMRLQVILQDSVQGIKIRIDTTDLPVNQWAHVAVIIAAGNYHVYINGTEVTYEVKLIRDNTATIASVIEEGDRFFLGFQQPNYNVFTGYIGELTVFDRVLTPTEIGYMANETSGFTGNVTNVDIGEVGMFPRELTHDEKAAFSIQGEKPTTTRKIDVANWQLKMKIEEI